MTGNAKTDVSDTGCAWVQPIRLTQEEIETLTDGTLRQVLAHNITWKDHCHIDD